jgi:hypothetical protein
VSNVLVDTDRTGPDAWAQLAGAQVLTQIASGDRWRLYAYDASRLDTYLDLATREGPAPELQRSGFGPNPAIAGRAVFARLEWAGQTTGQARLQATGPAGGFSREVAVGAQPTETLALPIPLDAPVGTYRLDLALAGGRTLALGDFAVGRLFQGEDLGGIVPGDSRGWTTLGGKAYHGDVAALAFNIGSTARQATPPIAAGEYCIEAGVWDYGTDNADAVEVGLGDARTQLEWSGAVAQARQVRGRLVLDRESGQLVMRVVRRDQPGVVLDWIEVYPAAGVSCA